MDDYLSKPVSLLDLRETLARWIEGSVERSQFGGHEDLTASSLGREARDSSIEEEPADLDVFDPQIALALLDGRRSMTAEVIGRFHVSLEGKVAVLLGALEHGEIKKAHLAAHSLRAGAAHVGASGLCRRFEALEAALDARDLGGAQALTSDLSVQVVRTLQAIGPWLMAQAEQPEGGAGVAAERAASQNPSD